MIATARGAVTEAALAELQRLWFERWQRLSEDNPAAAERLLVATVAHLRSIRPECVAAISLGPPTERIVDPRSVRP